MSNSLKEKGVIKNAVVIHQKCDRTAKVRVHRTQRHPKYHRVQRRYTDCLVETNGMILKVGSEVKIRSVPRISKNKSFVVISGY